MGKAIIGTALATIPAGALGETDLTLTTAQGGTTAAITYDPSAGADGIAAAINNAGTSVGLSAVATNSATLSGLSAAGTVSMELNEKAITANVTSAGDLSALAAAINGVAATTGVSASFDDPSNLSTIKLSTADGRDITIKSFLNSAASTDTIKLTGLAGGPITLSDDIGGTTNSARVVGTVDIYSSKGAITAVAANLDAFASATATSSFSAVSSISVAGITGAQSAIRVLDEALQQINSSRGDLGTLQNRFSSVITNLQTTSENLSASRSRIIDADFAAETASLTRAQILQQAGTAMLAQANALPNNVLSLLR